MPTMICNKILIQTTRTRVTSVFGRGVFFDLIMRAIVETPIRRPTVLCIN